MTASAQTAIDEQAVQTFPASVDGFRSQFNSVVEAYRVGGQAEGRRALELFQLPRSEEWLIEHLGPDPNGEFTNRYNRIFLSFESSLEKTIEDVQRTRNAKLLVSIDSTKQEMAPHPILGRKLSGIRIVKEPPLFYCHFTIQVKGRNAVLWADKFTYEAGAFRFIGFGTQPFWVWQDGSEGAGPREGYFVRLPILVSRVSPMYPTAALGKDGVVIVHYFVDEKGG